MQNVQAWLVVLALGGPLQAAVAQTPTVLPHCLVTLIEDVEAPAQEAGVLVNVNVREGDQVVKGKLLAEIDDSQAQSLKAIAAFEEQAAREKAESDIDVRYAQKAAKVAEAEYLKSAIAAKKGAVSQIELSRLLLTFERAELQIEQSQLERRQAFLTSKGKAAEVAAADAAIERRKIHAPFDGAITSVNRQAGEWVQPGDSVLKIARMNRLRVEGFLNSNEFSPSQVNAKPVLVEVELEKGRREQFSGQVVYVDIFDEAGGDYRVWAEVDNRQEDGQWLLRPGKKAQMAIDTAAPLRNVNFLTAATGSSSRLPRLAMPTLADSLASSSARKLNVRRRPDLSAQRISYQGRYYWVVKDPLALNYYRLHEEEYAILQMLDGEASIDDIKSRFERQYRPQKIQLEEIAQFIGMLHRNGLIIADTPGQGRQLHKRRNERTRRERLARWTNVLSIRFKGIDPDRLLAWMYPYVRWFFTPAAAICCAILGLAALTLVTVEFDVFQSKLPAFHEFFAARNWIWLGIALAVTKVIHEFGHGLMAKHFGGECHEMGVLLLVLTPCLYCNVTDSWMLRSKWQRAAIGAGGMYIELVMASIATFIWWFSEPGLLNQLCLSVMFVSSVSTVMFNANPLLRYDGYYILCDLMEIPNLRQKAGTVLHRKAGALLLGLEETPDPFLPRRKQALFAVYAVASAVYSWLVVLSILWFLHHAFGPELKIIGQIIALAALYGLLVLPIWKLIKFFYVPGRLDKVKKPRFYASLGVLAAIVLFILFVPLPYHVICSLEVKPRGAEPVYVSVPGTLTQIHVRAGKRVAAGTPLAELEDDDLDIALAELQAQHDLYDTQLQDLERRRHFDPKAALEVDHVAEAYQAVRKQLDEKRKDQRRLQLVAPVAGTVLPPPSVRADTTDRERLATWSGTPLEEKNLGAYLDKRVLLCHVGDPRDMEAILIIDQADIDFVQPGQPVEIKLEELPHDTFAGKIENISELDLEATPLQLSSKAGGPLVTKTDSQGNERPVSTSYQALVPLANAEGLLTPGLSGQAKIRAGSQTLGRRFWRYLSRTFNFELN